jgi:hypothetical protein
MYIDQIKRNIDVRMKEPFGNTRLYQIGKTATA